MLRLPSSDFLSSDFVKLPPHPLIYASLVPCWSPSPLRRMDLHKPKTSYTVGRGPLNDFVLHDDRSGQIDWTHCTLVLNEDGDVCIEENHTTNGIWVDNRRLDPGESCILKDGDSVRLGLCVLQHYKTHAPSVGYLPGNAYSYTFRSFITHSPPGLSASDESLHAQLNDLERAKADIVKERARLDQELLKIEKECSHVIQSMPDVPSIESDNTLKVYQAQYESLARFVRHRYPDFFPKDVRDFRPQPWLPPVVGPDDALGLYEMHRGFGALPNVQPPPLEKDHPMSDFTRVLHHPDAPSWNHPEVRWGGLQALNLSTPLMIPPTIIFWSIEYRLPVYMHPRFIDTYNKGPYAHPYASSEFVFSDETAAQNRAKLGLPPLENPRPLRPLAALQYRVKDDRTVPDEKELAEWVALLASTHDRSHSRSPEPPCSKSDEAHVLSSKISKRPRVSDVDPLTDDTTAPDEHTSHPASPTAPAGHDTDTPATRSRAREIPSHAPSAKSSVDAGLSATTDEPASGYVASSRTSKRRKILHSPTPSPATSIPTPHLSDDTARTLRASPEPLAPVSDPLIAVSVSSTALPEPPVELPDRESAPSSGSLESSAVGPEIPRKSPESEPHESAFAPPPSSSHIASPAHDSS
ncbi:hypothetical protein PENSPDRAFT_736154 [Peniophora sp. CONT]|nr:hypothetical protein PENSPDRAFT_736154 [Peniophora sp. CONT]